MGFKNITLGRFGENIAASFLKKNNYNILLRNYRNSLGEIDIIAKDNETICFIEVKTRHSDRFGMPGEAILNKKQSQISRAALCYLKENKLMDRRARFDVLSIMREGKNTKIDLVKDAFELPEGYVY